MGMAARDLLVRDQAWNMPNGCGGAVGFALEFDGGSVGRVWAYMMVAMDKIALWEAWIASDGSVGQGMAAEVGSVRWWEGWGRVGRGSKLASIGARVRRSRWMGWKMEEFGR